LDPNCGLTYRKEKAKLQRAKQSRYFYFLNVLIVNNTYLVSSLNTVDRQACEWSSPGAHVMLCGKDEARFTIVGHFKKAIADM